MKGELINPFISATISVFEQMANIELKKSGVSLKDFPTPSNEIAIIIGINGFIQGQIVYSLKTSTAKSFVQAMVPKETPITEELITASLGELTNIITGQTTIELSGRNRILHITPPTVVIGENNIINFVKLKTITVELSSILGTIEINIAIKEGNS